MSITHGVSERNNRPIYTAQAGLRSNDRGQVLYPTSLIVARLLNELPIAVPEELIDKAKVLDAFYIPTRYANGHPGGTPFEHYGPDLATDPHERTQTRSFYLQPSAGKGFIWDTDERPS